MANFEKQNDEFELSELDLENIRGGIPTGEITMNTLENNQYLLNELEEQKRKYEQYKQQIIEEANAKKR